MIKALIFDFFGVIGQSTYAYVKEIYQPSAEQSLAIGDLHRSLDYGFVNKHDFIKQYAQILGVSEPEITNIFNDADNHFYTSDLLLNFVDKNRHEYKIGLLSNVSGDAYKKFIEPIVGHFDVVVTSYSEQLAKPDVEIFNVTAQKLNLDVSECLMIDDNLTNCEGAMAAGMQAMQYFNFAQFEKQFNDIKLKIS